jgi:hypothetical protein
MDLNLFYEPWLIGQTVHIECEIFAEDSPIKEITVEFVQTSTRKTLLCKDYYINDSPVPKCTGALLMETSVMGLAAWYLGACITDPTFGFFAKVPPLDLERSLIRMGGGYDANKVMQWPLQKCKFLYSSHAIAQVSTESTAAKIFNDIYTRNLIRSSALFPALLENQSSSIQRVWDIEEQEGGKLTAFSPEPYPCSFQFEAIRGVAPGTLTQGVWAFLDMGIGKFLLAWFVAVDTQNPLSQPIGIFGLLTTRRIFQEAHQHDSPDLPQRRRPNLFLKHALGDCLIIQNTGPYESPLKDQMSAGAALSAIASILLNGGHYRL